MKFIVKLLFIRIKKCMKKSITRYEYFFNENKCDYRHKSNKNLCFIFLNIKKPHNRLFIIFFVNK